MNSAHYYKELPNIDLAPSQVLASPDLFSKVPSDWCVIVTDIQNSTQAVGAGQHQLVNLLATGSIIAALNIALKHQVEIPFFFGGDGATILVPAQMRGECVQALEEHRENARNNFELNLRVGAVAVDQVYQEAEIKLAKTAITSFLSIPIAVGAGLQIAERLVKSKVAPLGSVSTSRGFLDLSGMECRWDSIKPPQMPAEVMALLVDATDVADQGTVFASILGQIEEIYGSIQSRNPISRHRLRIKAKYHRIAQELTTKFGRSDVFRNLKYLLFTAIGKMYYGKTQDTRTYLDNLVQLSDTLSIDGRINTVFFGSAAQHDALLKFLTQLEEDGKVQFGYYTSPESIMSCYVRNRTDQHIHFVDGSEGGYTQAAKMLKAKLREAGHLS